MSLLDEIVDLSVKDDEKVSVLLRKCLVLAAKIKNDKLKEWVQHELNGYPYPNPNRESLPESFPEYRVLHIQARGNFLGPMGASVSDVVLAPSSMPDGIKWWAAKCYFAEPIAVFDTFLQGDQDPLRKAWPQDLVLHVRDSFYKGYSLVQAWQEVPKLTITGVLDAVRNRVLSFALDMQQDIGNTDEALAKADPARVDQQIINNIYGGHNLIADTAHHISQISYTNVVTGDFSTLSATLKVIGVDDSDLSLLEAAVKEDPEKPDKGSLGVRVTAWIGNKAVKAATGALKVGTDVTSKVVTEALLKFYGL